MRPLTKIRRNRAGEAKNGVLTANHEAVSAQISTNSSQAENRPIVLKIDALDAPSANGEARPASVERTNATAVRAQESHSARADIAPKANPLRHV